MVKQQRGFTLLELMIVVAIIGILASIAYPSYLRYIISGNRTDMMAELQNIATKIETKKLEKHNYASITQDEVMKSTSYPYSGTANYTLSLNISNTGWKLTATPKDPGQMKNDGTLTLDNQGIKCRNTSCGKDQQWNKT